MAKAKLKSTDTLGKMDAKQLAEMLRRKGRRGDTVLAHISPKEARKLKEMGGSGTINPATGLPEFAEDAGYYDYSSYGDFSSPDFQNVLDTYSSDYGATPEAYDTSGYEYYGGGDTYSAGGADYAAPQDAYYEPQYAAQSDLPSYGSYEVENVAAGGGFQPPLVGDRASVPVPLSREDVFQRGAEYPVSEAAAEERPMTEEEKAAETERQAQGKGYLERLFGKLDLGTLARLGLAGGAALMSNRQQQQAQKQAQAASDKISQAYGKAATDTRALADVYKSAYTSLAQAQQGALDPARLRQIEIERARLAQAGAGKTAVGAIQSAEAMNRARQDAVTAQQDAAYRMIDKSNALLRDAILRELEGTTSSLSYYNQQRQQAQQAAANLYGQLGRFSGMA
jgi:hypothetical protein